MTIRSRLLLLLLPPLCAFFILVPLFFYFSVSREILLIASSLTLLLVLFSVFAIADRISKPVRQLNSAALKIAAGDYETHIEVDGPKEINELAQTFNTMSECLAEHMSRLSERSLVRERMAGEVECARLLQNYMVQKVIDEFRDERLGLCLISPPLPSPQKGLLLTIEPQGEELVTLTLTEAEETGFASLFRLVAGEEQAGEAFAECKIDFKRHCLNARVHDLIEPVIWSVERGEFTSREQEGYHLSGHTVVLLFNSAAKELFATTDELKKWLRRILVHFAKDGLEALSRMAQAEMGALSRRLRVKHDLKIIALEVRRG